MPCVVTGASGFLGSRLVQLLVEEGADVRAIVRGSSHVDAPRSASVVRCDLSDQDALASALDGARVLFNCIGHSSDWGAWPLFRAGNIDCVERLWRAAARAGVSRLLHVSTTDVYGYPRIPCDESHPVVDVGLPYNRTKIAGEHLALALGAELGLRVSVVRPATIFGPRGRDWVVELGRQLQLGRVPTVGGGRSNAGLVFVDDVAEAMMALATTADAVGEIYNVVDPTPMSWRTYISVLCELLGAPLPRVDVPESLAIGLARLSEILWRSVGAARRPLITRHVVYLMCRDQHYSVEKLRGTLPCFPRIGLDRGVEATCVWLAAELDRRGGRL